MVKRLPTLQETRVRSLGRGDPLEKAMTTLSSTLPWKTAWTEEPYWVALLATVHGVAKSQTWLSDFTSLQIHIQLNHFAVHLKNIINQLYSNIK